MSDHLLLCSDIMSDHSKIYIHVRDRILKYCASLSFKHNVNSPWYGNRVADFGVDYMHACNLSFVNKIACIPVMSDQFSKCLNT